MRFLYLFVFLASSALAQDTAPPAFDVASVKVNQQFKQDDRLTWQNAIDASPDTLTMRNCNMSMILAWAYDVQRPQISGPEWLDARRYDIVAKAAGRTPEKEMQRMLQTLLAERFQLKLHRESKQMDALVVTVGKGGHKMKVSQTEGPPGNRQDPVLGTVLERVPLAELWKDVSKEVSTPVVDMTGLTGLFDFAFNAQKYVLALRSRVIGEQHPPSDAEARLMIMQDLLEGDLGLKLEPRRAAVEIVVVDRMEKTPIEN